MSPTRVKKYHCVAALVVACSALFGAVALAEGRADCASVTAGTRLEVYGYTHVVTLSNHCSTPVSCEVWTNVDPTPHLTLRAKAGETVETVTRRGSPSRDVQVGRQCRLGG